MIVNSRDFGQVELADDSILHATVPILGFEDYKDFVMLSDDEVGEGIFWLQSVEEPNICFILIHASVFSDYNFAVTDEMRKFLSLKDGDTPPCYLIAVLKGGETTINKKAPLLFGSDARVFGQFLLEEDYSAKAEITRRESEA